MYVYPRKQQSSSITFKSHNGSRSQQVRPGKQILRNQIRPNFLCSASLPYKILPTNLVACNQPFSLFIYHIRGERVYYEALFLPHGPWTESTISQFWKLNCTRYGIQYSGRSKHAWAVEKIFQNHLVYGQPVLTFDKRQICSLSWGCLRINRVTF